MNTNPFALDAACSSGAVQFPMPARPIEDARRPEVPRALGTLGERIEELSAKLELLSQRLDPALVPEGPCAASPANPGPDVPRSGVVRRIDDFSLAVSAQIDRVESMIRRLDL